MEETAVVFRGQTQDSQVLRKTSHPAAIVSYKNVVSPSDEMPAASSNAQYPVKIPAGLFAVALVKHLLCSWNEHFSEKVEPDLTVLVPDPQCILPHDVRITLAANGISWYGACTRDEQVLITVWGRDIKRILLAVTVVMKTLRGYGKNRKTTEVFTDRDTQLRFVICMATFSIREPH